MTVLIRTYYDILHFLTISWQDPTKISMDGRSGWFTLKFEESYVLRYRKAFWRGRIKPDLLSRQVRANQT